MAHQKPEQPVRSAQDVSPSLRSVGIRSWLYLGIALWVAVIFAFLSSISGLVVPLVIAAVMAMLFYPLVDWITARRVPRSLASLLVLVLVLLVLGGILWLLLVGIFSNIDQMYALIASGIAAAARWATALNVPGDVIRQLGLRALEQIPQFVAGLASFFTSGFSGAMAFFIGAFSAVFLLYYLLFDWHNVSGWVGNHLGFPGDLGPTMVTSITAAVRQYFYALTVSSLIVSVLIGLTMALLGLPLAFPIALVTMITSYIPYLGAIFSGAFASLVALAAGGLADGLIVLAVVLILQNVIQTIVQNKLASERLQLHPIVTFLTTIGGGILFGAFGAILANPVTAVVLEGWKRLQGYRHAQAHAVAGERGAVNAPGPAVDVRDVKSPESH